MQGFEKKKILQQLLPLLNIFEGVKQNAPPNVTININIKNRLL